MSVTEIPMLTFAILLFQFFILLAQFVFYLIKPLDLSRFRFLILIVFYMTHTASVGMISKMALIPYDFGQKAVSYGTGLLLGVYFLYYIHKEFKVQSKPRFGSASLFYSLGSCFLLLFLFPYYVFGNLEISRRLYLGIAAFIALVFLFKIGTALIKQYKYCVKEEEKWLRYKIITGYTGLLTLCMMPYIVLFGDHYEVEQGIVTFGFFAMMVSYIFQLIHTHQREEKILVRFPGKQPTNYTTKIDEKLTWEVLGALEQFEKDQDYLKGKITKRVLAEKCGTNTRYLSQIINSCKGKSTSDYINDLRIEHAKECLKHDEKFRNYTFKAMANDLGYVSSDAFTKAFYRKENIKLTEYIKRLRDQS